MMDYIDFETLRNLDDKEINALIAMSLAEISNSLRTIIESQKPPTVIKENACWMNANDEVIQ